MRDKPGKKKNNNNNNNNLSPNFDLTPLWKNLNFYEVMKAEIIFVAGIDVSLSNVGNKNQIKNVNFVFYLAKRVGHFFCMTQLLFSIASNL
jgi:hypothetical protein